MNMLRIVISSLLIGSLLGAGLSISEMINPAKVLAFLDFSGAWDPTLGAVMIGALVAAFPGFLLAKKRKNLSLNLLSESLSVPISIALLYWGRCCSVLAGGWSVSVRGQHWPRLAPVFGKCGCSSPR